MHTDSTTPGIAAGRLSGADLARNFCDAHPPMNLSQAHIEADRCYYCYDAPCQTACPTGIDVPSFIQRIADGNLRGAAHTILEANPLGGMCARVCPTEVLCEQACVRNTQEDKPVEIGQLQRYATDHLMANPGKPLFSRAAPSGKRVAVVGAGPAGLACAHGLARLPLQRLANSGGQIGPKKVRVHKWLRDNQLELIQAVTTGTNQNKQLSQVRLTHRASMTDSLNPIEQTPMNNPQLSDREIAAHLTGDDAANQGLFDLL